MQFGDVIAVTTAEPVTRVSPTPPPRVHRVANWHVMLAAGLAAILLLAIGVAIVVATYHPTQTTTARFDEPIRIGSAKPDVGSAKSGPTHVSVPAPEGTMRRMDAISKSFSKQ